MTPSTDVAKPEPGEVIQYDPNLFPSLDERSPMEVAASFAERFSEAKSLDDLFNVLQGNSSKAWVGRTIRVHAVRWQGYHADGGIIPQAVCKVTTGKNGEVQEFVTTAMVLTMFIRKAELLEALPFEAKIVEKKTRSGQTALNFERA